MGTTIPLFYKLMAEGFDGSVPATLDLWQLANPQPDEDLIRSCARKPRLTLHPADLADDAQPSGSPNAHICQIGNSPGRGPRPKVSEAARHAFGAHSGRNWAASGVRYRETTRTFEKQ